jgi:hypothetical protein
MSKSIKLVFHIGRPKTGTSFLQKNAKKVQGIHFFGKFYSNSQKTKLDSKLVEIHNELFSSYRAEALNAFPNPSRNSYRLINDYADIVSKRIINSPDKSIFLISDECIGDYSNFIGEWNTFLIACIGDIVEKKLEEDFSLKKVLSISLRSQLSIIPSHYGYTPTIRGNFKNWLRNGISNPCSGYFGGLFYSSSLKVIHSVLSESWQIKLTPYEILGIDNDPERYFREVFSIGMNFDLSNCDFFTKINKNSKEQDGKKAVINRKFNFVTNYGFRSSIQNENAAYIRKRSGFMFAYLYFSFKFFISKSIYYFGRLIDKLYAYFKKQSFIQLSNEEKILILETYKKDNEELGKFINLSDLKRYKYL